MNITVQTLQIFIFLLPGFFASIAMDMLVVRNKKQDIYFLVETLIFSMAIYTIYYSFIGNPPIVVTLEDGLIKYKATPRGVLVLFLISVSLPLLLSSLANNNFLMKWLNKLNISKNTSRNSVWLDVFYEFKKCYVIIDFSNGRRLYGWPVFYSDSPESKYLFLSQPAWITWDEKEQKSIVTELEIEGILITDENAIEHIEFLGGEYRKSD